MNKKYVVQLALAFDQGYIGPLYVLLTSLFKHNDPHAVVLHVIATGLTTQQQEDIVTFVTEKGSSIHFYEIQGTDVSQFVLPDYEENYLSVAIYYRLFFPFLISNVARLLYIDVDTLVVGDLSELFGIAMGDNPVAAVTDTDMPVRSELGIYSTNDYFNSGVLLIDIEKWKQQQITEKALKIIQEQPELINRYPDQDALNMALKDNWYKLPTQYNLMRLYVPNEVPKRQFKNFLKEQKIIHYNGKKPWFSDCEHRLRPIYKQYARLSPVPSAGNIKKVSLSKEKRDKLLRSRIVEFYFDHPEVVNVWRNLKKIVGKS